MDFVKYPLYGESLRPATTYQDLTNPNYWDCECEENYIHPKSVAGKGKIARKWR